MRLDGLDLPLQRPVWGWAPTGTLSTDSRRRKTESTAPKWRGRDVEIREECAGDAYGVREVNERAFGGAWEARLVDTLRECCDRRLSLVAAEDGRLVGHALFTPVALESMGGAVCGMGLGPLGVLPACQQWGVGSALVRSGLRRLELEGCPFVVVLGDPVYYSRFGFAPASGRGIRCEWHVPEDAFQIRILDPERMAGISGVVRYRPEFVLPL